MNYNYFLSQICKAIFIFLITVNAWAIVEPFSCAAQAQILNQSETDGAEKKQEENSDDEEDEEEPECD